MWYRMMLAVASLQATGSQAYAPIQMVSGQGKGLVVLPKGFPSSIRGAIVPQKLSVRSPSDNDTPSLIPYFTAKRDQTITWDEMGWCLEAIGSKPWDAVRVNSCTDVQTQKWTWIPDGSGQNMIQLKDTELCLDAIDQKAGLKGAQMALRGCGSKVARWQFEQPLLLPETLQDDSFSYEARHVIVVLLALAGIGAVSLGACIWQCGAKGNQDLEMVRAVMVVSPSHPSRASQPRARCTNDVENTGDKELSAELRQASLETIADYAAVAEGYGAGSATHDVSQNIDALMRALAGRPAPLDILDVCCAGGRDLVTFKKMGHNAVGLDGVARFCEMARQSSGCEVWQQDLQCLSLPPASFDGIFANACLFHVPSASLPGTLRELHRALKEGGALFCSNAHGFGEDREGWTNGRTPTTKSYVCWLSEDTWNKHCVDSGFQPIECFYRPPGKPREQQPFLATVWRKPCTAQE